MSRGAIMSIMGLFNNDPTVLDLMSFPAGFTDAQKQNVKDNILVECAELEVLYPNPTVMKNIIGIWSAKELPYWQRVYNASLLEYNPIENYRRNESETIEDGRTEEHSGSDVNRAGGSDSLARTGTEKNQASGSDELHSIGSGSESVSSTDDTTNSITGYDSNDFVTHDKSENEYDSAVESDSETTNTTTYGKTDTLTHNTTDTNNYGRTDTLQHGEKIEHEGTSERTVLAYGNIGVTTSQEMLTQEMEIAKIINVVPIIIESFKNRFCIMVY